MDFTHNTRVRWIAVLSGVYLAWFFNSLFGLDPKIIVSKETTVLTEPLAADGLPDFEAYLVKRAAEGVTPQNNAAVIVWRAIWPGHLTPQYWEPMCKALGIDPIPNAESSLTEIHGPAFQERFVQWLLEVQPPATGNEDDDWQQQLREDQANQIIDLAVARPWTSEQAPPLADWVAENQLPLNLLIDATSLPKFFSPSPDHLAGPKAGLVASLLPMEQSLRDVTRALGLRAMWHLGEGRPWEAWQHLRATLQYAQFSSQGWTLVNTMVAIAIEGHASARIPIVCHEGEFGVQQAREILHDLQSLPPLTRTATIFDHGERLNIVDSALGMATGRNDSMGTFGDSKTYVTIDWNLILRDVNRVYDRMTAAAQLPSRAQRLHAWSQIENDILDQSKQFSGTSRVLAFFHRRTRSRAVGSILLNLLVPATGAAFTAQDRGDARRALTIVAAALAVYRAQHREYPAALAALVPDILPELPVDIFSEKPFIYERKSDGGYLLYSVGDNGVDDGGTDLGGEIIAGEWVDEEQEVDNDKSDLVIRVPVPPFWLPELPLAE